MKVLVCGGRNFADKDLLEDVLKQYEISVLIHGGARGADTLAEDYARGSSIEVVRVPALWALYGKRAGYIRNAEMLKHSPKLVIAFPGGKGTAMMVKLAKQEGIEVMEVKDSQ